jgi:hypothetical protein
LANADMQNHGDGTGVPAQVAADRIAMSSLPGKSCRPRPKSRTFGTMAAAGVAAYLRSRDLPKLIALAA